VDKQILNIINAIPIWAGNIEIKKLEGGITNDNFLVKDNKKSML
jgi:hypothetical protein